MAQQLDYETLYRRLEPACSPQMARVLSETLLEIQGATEQKRDELNAQDLAKITRRLKRLKMANVILGLYEFLAIGMLVYLYKPQLTGFDVYLFMLFGLAAVCTPFAMLILVDHGRRLRKRVEALQER